MSITATECQCIFLSTGLIIFYLVIFIGTVLLRSMILDSSGNPFNSHEAAYVLISHGKKIKFCMVKGGEKEGFKNYLFFLLKKIVLFFPSN